MRARPARSSTSSANNNNNNNKSSGSDSAKVFINSSGLSLVGERIPIGSQVRVIGKKQHRIELEDSDDGSGVRSEDAEEASKAKKESIALKKCAPLCEDVVTRQVRKIRETVQVGDLERLLISVTGNAAGQRSKKGVSVGRLGQVYQEFFGAYYDVLREVVIKNKKKMTSIT